MVQSNEVFVWTVLSLRHLTPLDPPCISWITEFFVIIGINVIVNAASIVGEVKARSSTSIHI